MARYVLEGEWSGYSASQQRIVHREAVDARFAKQAKDLRCIVFTDGTSLFINIRPATPRERVFEIGSYTSLIRDAVRHGGSHVFVSAIVDARRAATHPAA